MAEKHSSDFAVDLPRVRIELDCRPNLPFGLFCLSLLLKISRFDAMGLGQPRIDLKCALSGRERVLVPTVDEPQLKFRESHQSPCLRVVVVEKCRLPAEPNDRLLTSWVSDSAANPLLPRHQVKVVGLYVRRAAALDRLLLRGKKFQSKSLYNSLRNLVLYLKDVGEVPVEAVSPKMVTSYPIDQLRINPHPSSGLPHAAFEHVTNPEALCDILHVHGLPLEHEGSIASDNIERGYFRQIGGDVLADAVAKVFLLRLAAHVGKR